MCRGITKRLFILRNPSNNSIRNSIIRYALLVIAVLVVASLGVSAYANNDLHINSQVFADGQSLVSLYADGQRKTVPVSANTVGEALDKLGVKLKDGDVVEPATDTKISQALTNINVYRGLPYLVVDGNKRRIVQSGYRSPRQIIDAAGITVYPEDTITETRVDDFLGEKAVGSRLDIVRATPVNVLIGGKPFVFRTNQKTVAGLLKEKGINIEANDRMDVAPTEPIHSGMKIVIARFSQGLQQEFEPIPAGEQISYDPNQLLGYEAVTFAGVDGKKMVTYVVDQQDGKPVGRHAIQEDVVTPPQPKQIVRGSKVDPVGTNAEILRKLRQCEAGGNYQRNSGNGYYGAYQFSYGTWAKYGTGYERADLAPPEVQDAIAIKNARISSFWSQWPSCSIKLGLPKYPY